jgi:hypothetical protein
LTGAGNAAAGPVRAAGGWRAALIVPAIVAAGVASSLLVGVAGWWLWSHRLVWDWAGMAGDVAAFAVVAVWCRYLAERGRCDAERRLYLSPAIGLVALACRSGAGELLMPCGRCRQVIYEFGGPELMVDTPEGPQSMTWVLPAAFGPEHLPGAVGSTT